MEKTFFNHRLILPNMLFNTKINYKINHSNNKIKNKLLLKQENNRIYVNYNKNNHHNISINFLEKNIFSLKSTISKSYKISVENSILY